MFHRERPEKEYRYGGIIRCRTVDSQLEFSPLYKKYEIGTTVFSALASGLLTGKVWSKWSKKKQGNSHSFHSIMTVSPRVLGLRCIRNSSRGQSRVSKERRVLQRSGKLKSSQHLPSRVSKLSYYVPFRFTLNVNRTWVFCHSPSIGLGRKESQHQHCHTRCIQT